MNIHRSAHISAVSLPSMSAAPLMSLNTLVLDTSAAGCQVPLKACRLAQPWHRLLQCGCTQSGCKSLLKPPCPTFAPYSWPAMQTAPH